MAAVVDGSLARLACRPQMAHEDQLPRPRREARPTDVVDAAWRRRQSAQRTQQPRRLASQRCEARRRASVELDAQRRRPRDSSPTQHPRPLHAHGRGSVHRTPAAAMVWQSSRGAASTLGRHRALRRLQRLLQRVHVGLPARRTQPHRGHPARPQTFRARHTARLDRRRVPHRLSRASPRRKGCTISSRRSRFSPATSRCRACDCASLGI